MAAATTDLQLIIFDYVMNKISEVKSLMDEAVIDAEKLEEFAFAFEEVSEKRDEFLANYFALCAVPPQPEKRSVDELKGAFLMFERHFRQLRIAHNRCTVRAADLPPRATTTRAVLPPIPLPKFSGSRADWSSFSELFKSIVDQDTSLGSVQKLHYLIGCLTDEPKQLVSNLPLTKENYVVIWELLEKRYQNKRIRATIHVQRILHLSPVTSKSIDSLSSFVSAIRENLNALRADDFPVSEWSFLLLNILLEKLDPSLRQDFELIVEEDVPTCEQLLMFLERRSVACENVRLVGSHGGSTSTVSRTYNKSSIVSVKSNPRQTSGQSSTTLVALQQSAYCVLCNENHLLHRCEQFLSKSVDDRVEFARDQSLCFNCLKPHHSFLKCMSKFSCMHCHRKHHSLLHFNRDQHLNQALDTQTPENKESLHDSSPNQLQALHLSNDTQNRTTILLATALVQVRDNTGQFQVVRALLDGASQTSFITEHCVQRLGLKRHREVIEIAGVGQTPVPGAKGATHCFIKPVHGQNIHFDAKVTILSEITHPLPCSRVSSSSVKHLKDLNLADPSFDRPGPVDMLLAADIVSEVMTGPKISGEPNAFHSLFGWVVTGKTQCEPPVNNSSVSLLIRTTSLDSQLQRFWEIEEIPSSQIISEEDRKCEDHFLSTHTRNAAGRYTLRLPFRDEVQNLGDSFQLALSRYEHLEKKLKRLPQLAHEYQLFLKEYEDLGHMTRLLSVKQLSNQRGMLWSSPVLNREVAYVIPHHAVHKETSSTTKVRVVFDGSAATHTGTSLNDLLHTGPKLQKEIGDIILNFRTKPIVFTADICKMYRQIEIHPEDRKFQCILWRPTSQDDVHVYQLNTVTYGLASSPYQALRTLQQLAQEEAQQFPHASQVLLRDVFVDDIVSGAHSVDEAIQLTNDLVSLLARGGFELRKWSCNNPVVLADMPVEHHETLRSFNEKTSPAVKVLGVHWCPTTDEFVYHINVPELPITKRSILSTIARLFDPCGWVSPVIVWGKILLQTLWTLGLEWDQPVTEEIAHQWSHFRTSLSALVGVRIPRYISLLDACSIQFHGFCDASEKAYAAVIYVRLTNKLGVISTQLVAAKSKVAPLKTLSVPRLELSGALLLARLWQYLNNQFENKLCDFTIHMWCDSTTVLSWIKSSPHKFKTRCV